MTRSVFFEEVAGKKIFCAFSEPANPAKKLVIMSHGFRGSSIGPARQFVDFERLLVKGGYSVLRFDQPNCGNSEGDFLQSSFNEWVATIVYFADKYLKLGYKVALLGQSMGASATVVATSKELVKDKIPCLLLWVPDAKSNIEINPDETYEEGGQKFKGTFWQEARDTDFFACLRGYGGGIHLVYGETDRYVHEELKNETTHIVKEKGQGVMILKDQDHSPWDYDLVQKVFEAELGVLNKYLA